MIYLIWLLFGIFDLWILYMKDNSITIRDTLVAALFGPILTVPIVFSFIDWNKVVIKKKSSK